MRHDMIQLEILMDDALMNKDFLAKLWFLQIKRENVNTRVKITRSQNHRYVHKILKKGIKSDVATVGRTHGIRN